MNKNIIFILFIVLFYSCELQLPEEPESPAWHVPITIPLIDTEYSFEGILQEGVLTSTAEDFEDTNGNGIWDNGSCSDNISINQCDCQENGIWTEGENFTDENNNCIWDEYGSSDGLLNMIQMESCCGLILFMKIKIQELNFMRWKWTRMEIFMQ